MNSQDLIIKELNDFSLNIEGIEIRYEFDRVNLIHLIEVKPLDLYENNLSYQEREIKLEEKFYNLYPYEEIVFISEDSLSKIINPDLVLPLRLKYLEIKDVHFKFSDMLDVFNLNAGENNYALAA